MSKKQENWEKGTVVGQLRVCNDEGYCLAATPLIAKSDLYLEKSRSTLWICMGLLLVFVLFFKCRKQFAKLRQ